MSDKTLKILVVEPMQPCRVQEIPHTLEAMQQIVGGYIESFSYQREAIISNEEGKLLDLPRNRPLYDNGGTPIDMLRGTFFIAGIDGEHLVSLTDEQIQRYKALYDNIVERSAVHTEISPDVPTPDFAVSCQVSFHFVRKEQESPVLNDAFISHVTGIFNRDEVLAERTVGDLNFSFQGSSVNVQYTFARRDKDAASAERFSEQCVRRVQDQLEGYGCKIEKIDCFAEELEDDLSHAKNQLRGREPQGKKKGNHHER